MINLFSKIVLILALFFPFTVPGQNIVSGKVYDSVTKEPLPFVNIVVNEGKTGGTTDIDGRFSIGSSEKVQKLRLSYVGYQLLEVPIVKKSTGISIYMVKKEIELSEVTIIAGENPAHRIINLVLENRDRNNPEKIAAFSYTSYDKMVFTADTLNAPKPIPGQDTLDKNLHNFLDKRNFFIMETVSERKFMSPAKNYEKVIATKISGFKDPFMVFLISQIQSTSFYKEIISIGSRNFINPISDGSFSKYFFFIEDTTYSDKHDTVFIISFHPYKGTNFDGLKGVLSINSNGWAIQNVAAEPDRLSESFKVSIQQMYELMEDRQWFPVQFNIDLIMKNIQVNQYAVMANGRSYIRNIEINPELVKRQFSHIEVDVDPNAGYQNDNFWNNYRTDSLSMKEIETYRYIDSIGKAENLEQKMKTFQSLWSGKIPLWLFNLDIDRFAHYNEYEKLFIGLGMSTNRRLSQRFDAGGFWGYGFGDKAAKYGGFANIIIDRFKEFSINLDYSYDLSESAACNHFSKGSQLLSPDVFRNLLLKTFDLNEHKELGFSFRTLKYFFVSSSLSTDWKKPLYNYAYKPLQNEIQSSFRFTAFSVAARFAWKEKFMKTPTDLVSLGSKYPTVELEYSLGLNDFLNGQFRFDKFDLKVNSSWYTKYLGLSKITLLAGLINGDVPYSEMYNGNGSFRKFTIYAPGSFNTMGMNEFAADRYVSLFFVHETGRLLFRSRGFQPEPAFALNGGFGWLNQKNVANHLLFDKPLTDFREGYFEAGLLLNNIINLKFYKLGAGLFYRIGKYSFNDVGDNFSYRFSLTFPM